MSNKLAWAQVQMKICFLGKSWTRGWRQIHKIKQNMFFYGMFYNYFFAIFYQITLNLAFGWTVVYSPSNPSISGISLKFPNFLRSSVFFFFFLVWAHRPPQRRKCRGDIFQEKKVHFRKMIGTIIKKVLCTIYTKSSLSLNKLISMYAVLVERILFQFSVLNFKVSYIMFADEV